MARNVTTLRGEDLDHAQVMLAAGRGWDHATAQVNQGRVAAGLPATSRRALRRALQRHGRPVSWPGPRGRPPRIQPLSEDECKSAIQQLGASPHRPDYDRVAAHLVQARRAAGVDEERARFSGSWLQLVLRRVRREPPA